MCALRALGNVLLDGGSLLQKKLFGLVSICFDLSVYSSTPLFLFYEYCLGQITANKMLLLWWYNADSAFVRRAQLSSQEVMHRFKRSALYTGFSSDFSAVTISH